MYFNCTFQKLFLSNQWPCVLNGWQIQWNPVKKILKIPRKSYCLSSKFLKRVILVKWENFCAFLSSLLRREIFLTGFFLSEFHCNLVDHVFEDDHFMSSYSKLQHTIDTVLVLYKKVCKDMWNKVKQPSITSSSPIYSIFPRHSRYIVQSP
jgi:hypothetical protein